jgi:hypothetical protein
MEMSTVKTHPISKLVEYRKSDFQVSVALDTHKAMQSVTCYNPVGSDRRTIGPGWSWGCASCQRAEYRATGGTEGVLDNVPAPFFNSLHGLLLTPASFQIILSANPSKNVLSLFKGEARRMEALGSHPHIVQARPCHTTTLAQVLGYLANSFHPPS